MTKTTKTMNTENIFATPAPTQQDEVELYVQLQAQAASLQEIACGNNILHQLPREHDLVGRAQRNLLTAMDTIYTRYVDFAERMRQYEAGLLTPYEYAAGLAEAHMKFIAACNTARAVLTAR